MKPIRILLQTTIPFVENDWHVGRFSLLARELAASSGAGRPIEVTARDRASLNDDPVLSTIDRSGLRSCKCGLAWRRRNSRIVYFVIGAYIFWRPGDGLDAFKSKRGECESRGFTGIETREFGSE